MKTRAIFFVFAVFLFAASSTGDRNTKDPALHPDLSLETIHALGPGIDLTLPYAGSTSVDGFAFGITNMAQGNNTGIIGSSWGEKGKGIHGIVTSNLPDAVNYGGYFQTAGGKGIAVFGEAAHPDWVENYGGYFLARGKYGYGVYGLASGGHGMGVFGKNEEYGYIGYLGGMQFGVQGRHLASGTTGCLGNISYGVVGQYGNSGPSGYLGTEKYGVLSNGPLMVHGAGLRVENAVGDPIMTIDGPSGWNTDFWGKVVIRSRPSGQPIIELGEGLDYAEGFDVTDKTEIPPGSVLIIDPDSSGKLKLSDKEYDRRVAGIACGGNGNKSGVRLGASGHDVDVALAGRVYCFIDTSYGEVTAGDLLTTSPTPGHAMVAKDHSRAQGAIIGKAMESMPRGRKGQILALVTLQ